LKISNPRYHWEAEQGKRDRKAAALTGEYTVQEQADLHSYPLGVPSPKGSRWRDYLQHRIKMLFKGMAVYATQKYARLDLDKYIKSNRAMDKIALQVTKNQPTIVHIGAAELAPNRPIGIKKRKRCPGTRRLVNSIKKLGHSRVNFVDEYYTSQTCANCFGRFDRKTKPDRFKVCRECVANPEAGLPPMIITQLSKRKLQEKREIERIGLEQDPPTGDEPIKPKKYLSKHEEKRDKKKAREEQNRIDNGESGVQPIHRQNVERLVPKTVVYRKYWPQNTTNDEWAKAANWPTEIKATKVVWHRDIVAAKCILYKGRRSMFGLPIHPSLLKSPPQPPDQLNANNANNAN